ncbi:MAG: Glucitol operon repressor [Actinobacteria bacterium ADurb.Bin346]|nr:MAG: Glucitol operon repressor [Actinobacteria bacterium ADurb.Bin346]
MLGEERREYILNFINRAGSISAIDTARALKVSETTIRRDLNRLASKGLVRRTHGGAINIVSVGHEMKFDIQKEKNIDEKKRIALAAYSLIGDDEVILIEAGTTGYQLALNITSRKNLTIITNSCEIAALLGKTNPDYKIILSGGVLNSDTLSLVGPIADNAFRNIFADTAFIGISGIDLEKGITAVDFIEAQTKRYIINCAKHVVALCDYSKIGHISINFVAPVKKINTFISDMEADKGFTEKLQEMEIEVILV